MVEVGFRLVSQAPRSMCLLTGLSPNCTDKAISFHVPGLCLFLHFRNSKGSHSNTVSGLEQRRRRVSPFSLWIQRKAKWAGRGRIRGWRVLWFLSLGGIFGGELMALRRVSPSGSKGDVIELFPQQLASHGQLKPRWQRRRLEATQTSPS